MKAALTGSERQYAKQFIPRTAPGAHAAVAAPDDVRASDRGGRRKLRAMMPWIKATKLVDKSRN